jgi:hypothetical protein
MALPNYLSLVNDVLVRLREPEVTTVNENNLSKLIGKFINDSKRQVEDAYRWNALTNTLTATTAAGVFNYALVGTNHRFRVIEVYDNTSKNHLSNINTFSMTQKFLGSGDTPQTGAPAYYNFNGIDSNGDTQVDLFPVPDKEYQIFFNIYDPQPDLAADSNTMKVPAEPVIQLTYARALVERGEDGGLQSSEAYDLFKQVLADYIAIESSRYVEEEAWVVV